MEARRERCPVAMNKIAAALVADLIALLRSDPEIRERFREALDVPSIEAWPIIYTTKTLAAEWGVTEETVRRAIRRGELVAERRGKAYVITREAVEEWASAGRAIRRSSSALVASVDVAQPRVRSVMRWTPPRGGSRVAPNTKRPGQRANAPRPGHREEPPMTHPTVSVSQTKGDER